MGQAEIVCRQAIAVSRSDRSRGTSLGAVADRAGRSSDLTQATDAPTIDGRFQEAQQVKPAMTFDAVPNAPQDPILGLNDAFRADRESAQGEPERGRL